MAQWRRARRESTVRQRIVNTPESHYRTPTKHRYRRGATHTRYWHITQTHNRQQPRRAGICHRQLVVRPCQRNKRTAHRTQIRVTDVSTVIRRTGSTQRTARRKAHAATTTGVRKLSRRSKPLRRGARSTARTCQQLFT